MSKSEFTVEFVSDINEKYPRMEVTRGDDSFAFLDFSALEDRSMVINFWGTESHFQISIERMRELLNDAEKYLEKSILNVDNLNLD